MRENCAAKRFNRRRIGIVSVSVLLVSAALLVISFRTSQNGRTMFGNGLGADWLAFYDAATILNHHEPARLYDLKLQAQLYHENLPSEPSSVGLPYANAPFLALLLRPLAWLPYAWSYGAWVVISIFMFVAAIALAWRAAGLPREHFLLGLLACLSFEPLAIECIHGGQVSAVGLLVMCAAMSLHLTNRPYFAGLVLALCAYKPTLLLIVLPMLLLGRQWRVLGGFFCGVGLLAWGSLAAMGPKPCLDYVNLLLAYAGQTAAPAQETVFRIWKFVDLNSFLKLLGLPVMVIAPILMLCGYTALRCAAWVTTPNLNDPDDRDPLRFVWAATLAMTLVLNVYVGVYDTVLVLPALLLTAGVIHRCGSDEMARVFRVLCVTIYILPWCSQIVARETGYQPFTLALVLLVFFQYRLFQGPAPSEAAQKLLAV